MQVIHASLSDEDYGILYNFVMAGPPAHDISASLILVNQVEYNEYIFGSPMQQRLDFATLLIYESGRELP